MIPDSTILLWQIAASALMATDYFFDEKQRGFINRYIKNVVIPVDEKLNQAIEGGFSYLVGQWLKIVILTLSLLLAWFVGHFLPEVKPYLPDWVVPILALAAMALIAVAGPRLVKVLAAAAVTLAMASPMKVVTAFLLWCPKGTIFGCGFICLLVSFGCRYLNLK